MYYGGGMTNILHDAVRPNMQSYIAGTNRYNFLQNQLTHSLDWNIIRHLWSQQSKNGIQMKRKFHRSFSL